MSQPNQNAPTDPPAEAPDKPMSTGGRIMAALIGLGLLALAYYMFTHYNLFDSAEYTGTRARTGFWLMVIKALWSRPAAVIIGLLGLLACFGGIVGDKGPTKP